MQCGFMISEWMCRKCSRSKLCKCCLFLSYVHVILRSYNRDKRDDAMISFTKLLLITKTIKSMHGLREKWEQKEMQHFVGLIGNLPMLSWINWSNILSHGDQSKQAMTVSMVAFVIWWMKMVFHMAKRLLLPIIRCRGYLLHEWIPFNQKKI